MRIGIYDPYLDDIGGGEKYMMTIATCLAGSNDVSIFWDKKDDLQVISHRFGMDLSKVNIVPNLFKENISTMTRFFKTRQFDCLIILSDGSIPFVGSKKLFLHIQQPLNEVENSLWGKFKLSRVDKIFCNSVYTKDFVDKMLHCNAEVLYPPVALFPKNVKKKNMILHVGRFRVKNVGVGDYKKQYIMINAFKEMVKKGLKDWKFILAVSVMDKDKETFETLKQTTKGFPIEFLINKTNHELWDAYSQAKIYWHATGFGENLQKHPEYAEHFGISTVEAMGAGVVPVVVGSGGQKEIVTDNKEGFLWNTLEELETKTTQLIDHPVLLKTIATRAKERAEDFNKHMFCQSVQEIIL